MEECEKLCDKIAIMVSGRFVSIGSSEELKLKFNVGNYVLIKLNQKKSKNQVSSIKSEMQHVLDCQLVDENSVCFGKIHQ